MATDTHNTDTPAPTSRRLFRPAVILPVLGVIACIYIVLYSLGPDWFAAKQTDRHLQSIATALADYAATNGAYPCPANPGFDPGVSSYGKQAPGCAEGIGPVSSGMAPFIDLDLPAQTAIDSWGNKIGYHVTRALTVPDSPAKGAIKTDGAPGGTTYVLISHGPNGAGAWSRMGGLSDCPDTGEGENCDGDAEFTAHPGQNKDTPFDDILRAGPRTPHEAPK